MSTPHDRLFRYVFSDPEHARGLLAALVPEALGARIDWPSLELVPGSFVAPELSERETDALFRVELDVPVATLMGPAPRVFATLMGPPVRQGHGATRGVSDVGFASVMGPALARVMGPPPTR